MAPKTRIFGKKSYLGKDASTSSCPPLIEGTPSMHEEEAREEEMRSASESSSDDDAQTEVGEESDDEQLPPQQQEAEIDVTKLSSEDFVILRQRNQFNLPRSSTDSKFHTRLQEKIFSEIYGPTKKFADQKHVVWAHLRDLEKYNGVFRLFQRSGLDKLVAMRNDYNHEVIKQFYATVHISPNYEFISWMTRHMTVNSDRREFELALDTESGGYEKVFSKPALPANQVAAFYDQTLRYIPGKLPGLLPLPSIINKIINCTILPKSGNYDAIRGHAWNVIHYIMNGQKFDVVDLILREIAATVKDRTRRINYAPYIMALIEYKTQWAGGCGGAHKPYKPRADPPVPVVPPPPADPVAPDQAQPAQSAAQPSANQESSSQVLEALQRLESSISSMNEQVNSRFTVLDEHVNSRLSALNENLNAGLASLSDRMTSFEQKLSDPAFSQTYSRRRRTDSSPQKD